MLDLTYYFPILTAPYKQWSDKKLVSGSHYMYTCVKDNALLPPTLEAEILEYGLISADFRDKVAIAANREITAIVAKDLARFNLLGATFKLSNSITNVANGDIEMLSSVGMELRKKPQSIVLGMPENLVIVAGNGEGKLKVKINSVIGAKSYVARYTLDPQTPASQWTSVACTTRQCVLTGLQSGAKYWIMIGAVGSKGITNWSVSQLSPFIP